MKRAHFISTFRTPLAGAWTALAFLLAWTSPATAQVITTVAGTSYVIPSSGTTALKAALGHATGVAVDGAGNRFIVDDFDSIVAKVSPDGIFTVVAGNGHPGYSGDGGPATTASLNTPWSVAVDGAGNVYIADAANHRIRKVSQGVITTVAGNGEPGFAGDGGPATNASLLQPLGVAVDAGGSLYIADFGNGRIRKVTNGVITTIAGNGKSGFSGDGGPAVGASLSNPEGVAVDAAGNVFIADVFNHRIRKVAGGTITTVAGNGQAGFSGNGATATNAAIKEPRAVAVDAAGNLYIADTGNYVVRKVAGGIISTAAGNGLGGALGDGGPATNGSIVYPSGVAVDGAGVLYIADFYRARLRQVSGGIISTAVGSGLAGFSGDGGSAASATLNLPLAIAVDGAGRLYIADSNNNRIRRVAGGVITTIAGNGTAGYSGDGGAATAASLNFPTGVAVDAAGNVYVADAYNNRIRRIAPNGTISTVAGNGSFGFSGDGGFALNATLATPFGVSVDAAGNFYIADSDNHRIRKVSGGTITTVAGSGMAGFSGDGGLAVNAAINRPQATGLDGAGNLYIADTANHRIRRVSGGVMTTVAGSGAPGGGGPDSGPATSVALFLPSAVAVDGAGNLYIADLGNNRVRKVAGGNMVTVAGDGSTAFLGDGGPSTSASFNNPVALAFDPQGNLFIADSANNRVREVLAASTTYQATPAALSFTATAGGGITSAQVVTLSSGVPGQQFQTSASVPWLTVTPATGTVPATLQVSADPSTLGPGVYQATLAVTVPQATPATRNLAVTFTVAAAASQTLDVDTKSLSLTAKVGSAPVGQTIEVLNAGGGSLAFTASIAPAVSWLTVSPATGSAATNAPGLVTVTATPGTLAAGTYNTTITVTGAGKSIAIPVTFSLSAPAATLLLSQSALTFQAVAQGGAPLPQSFGILNTGQGSMSWTAAATTLSGGPWLSLSERSGTVARPYLDVSLVEARIDPATLSPGTYYGRIQVSAPASNTPQLMTVILTVLPAGFTLGPQVFPAGLIFTGEAGVTPGSQDVAVGNPGARANSFLSGIIGASFSYLPTNAAVQPNQPTMLHVYPDYTKLAPGSIQRGTITLQFDDGAPSQTVNVLMVVAPSGTAPRARTSGNEPGDTAATIQATACGTQGLLVVFRSPQPSQTTFRSVIGQATTLDVQVTDRCGNLIGSDGIAQVTARFSNNDSVKMTHIGNGVWQGSWTPVSVGQGSVRMVVTALAGKNGETVGGESAVLTAMVSAPAAATDLTPTVTPLGVVHAASAKAGVPIAPGGLISIYGENLADAASVSNGLPLPVEMNGTQVLMGNQPLPILYTSGGQLNVQVPYSVPVNGQYQISVQHGSTLSVPQQLVVAAAQPGIFTVNQTGSGQGSIVKSDQVTVARPGTPARIGETIVIYCAGLGSVTPAVKEGVPAPTTSLSRTDNPVTVTIGGRPAGVQFSGLTPGYAGLYQVNAVVPEGVEPGDEVPVTVAVGGQVSPAVTIAVR